MSKQGEQLLELGKLYCDRGDFVVAIEKLNEASALFHKEKNYSLYLDSMNLILRMHAEREEFEAINLLKEKLQDLVLKEGFELSSKTYYVLAVCASYKGQQDTALDYLQKSLAIALQNDNKVDLCHAITGIALCYKQLGRYADALKEIYNLQVFFQVLDVPDIKISTQIINANILTDTGKPEQAIELLWQAYDTIRSTKKMTTYVHLLHNMGRAYFQMGEKDLARMYLQLAWKSVDPENMVALARRIRMHLDQLGMNDSENYDLVFDFEDHTLVEKKLGKVDFKNQFILLDLLRLFAQNLGQVYSKEYLVQNVWKQSYDPGVHDNKIYVTIKRLRKMIEPDFDKPKYIFRAKNGYYMNKSARILIQN